MLRKKKMINNITFECIKGVIFFRIKNINLKEIYKMFIMIKDSGIRNIVLCFYNKSIINYLLIIISLIFTRKYKGLLVVCASLKRKSFMDILITKTEEEALKEFV